MKYLINIDVALNNKSNVSKNLKNVMSVITLTLVMLLSFNVNAQKIEYSKEQIEDVKIKLRQGMNLFVESVKPFYKKGMSFEEYKLVLVGKNNKNITVEGNALLKKAYIYISNSTSSEKIIDEDSTIEFVKALSYINKSNSEKNSSDREFLLFGSTKGNTFPLANNTNNKKAYPCRWFQIRCHLVQLFGDSTADDILGAASCAFILLIGGSC